MDNKKSFTPRTEEQVRRDHKDIAALLVKGFTIQDVADWMNQNRDYSYAYTTAARDCATVRRAMNESAFQSKKDFLISELARLEQLEKEYWGEWKRSQDPYEEHVYEETADIVDVIKQDEPTNLPGRPAPSRPKKQVEAKKIKKYDKTVERAGNLEALRGIFDIIGMRVKLLRLDAPNVLDEIEEWRKGAEESGVPDASALFQELVAHAAEKMRNGEINTEKDK